MGPVSLSRTSNLGDFAMLKVALISRQRASRFSIFCLHNTLYRNNFKFEINVFKV